MTNASVNPARSTGTAIFAGGWTLAVVAFPDCPDSGRILGGGLYQFVFGEAKVSLPELVAAKAAG